MVTRRLAQLGVAAAAAACTSWRATAFSNPGGVHRCRCTQQQQPVQQRAGARRWRLQSMELSAKKRKSAPADDSMSFFDDEEQEELQAPVSNEAAAGAGARDEDVGPVFGERLVDPELGWDEHNWEDPVNAETDEYIGLDDLDFEELEYELEAESKASRDSSGLGSRRGGMEYYDDYGGADRELEDILMERSLRFYDPKVVGEREKVYLVGLEARGYGATTQDKQRSTAALDGFSQEEREGAAAAAAQQRRADWENRFTLEESLSELSELAGTAGLEVVGTTYQRVVEPNPRTYIGTGKVKEVRRAMRALACKTVIIDHELSPGQQRSLEAEFGGEEEGIKVLDRTALILDIFAQHARTREGQLQVELALHLYRLPRLTKLWTHLERQSGAAGAGGGKSGGVGLRGPGERQLEVDRRLLKAKITDLQRLLKDVRRHRALHRRRRESLGLPIVALVGYTNAGKSTVLNSLTSAAVLAEDMLFATLDPTTRRVKLPGLKVHPEIMLTDTVGFIQKLPTNLVAAFRATLEEVQEADVIVHVCDVSNPAWPKQQRAVLQVLRDLDALEGVPVVTLWNKLDALPEAEREPAQLSAATEHDMTVAASARTGRGMDDFVAMLEVALGQLLRPVEALVPFAKGDLLSRVHELGACDVEEYRESGCFIRARVPEELLNRLRPYFTEEWRQRERRAAAARARQGGAAADALSNELGEAEWAAIAKGRHSVQKQA